MRKFSLLVTCAIILGAVLGFSSPNVSASVLYRMVFSPSVAPEGEIAWLTTGWHNYGGEPYGLDWGVSTTRDTYLKVWAYDPVSSSGTARTWVSLSAAQWELCQNAVRADLYDIESSRHVGTYWFVHTKVIPGNRTGANILHSSAGFRNDIKTATMTDGDSCKWFGVHTHEVNDVVGVGMWTRNPNTTTYPVAAHYSEYPCVDSEGKRVSCARVNNDRNNWTREVQWYQ